MYYDMIVFDCDGVILDSNQLKTQAFKDTLKNFSVEEVNTFIIYHKANGGVSRFEKFAYFLNTITSQTHTSIDTLLNEYKKISIQYMLEANFIDGAIDFLENISSKSICAVNSGGAEKDLEYIFKEKNIDKYFQNILGSPKSKEENMDMLLAEHNPKDILFIGDSLLDFQVAQKYNMDFIFIYGKTEYSGWKENEELRKYKCIKDFKEI